MSITYCKCVSVALVIQHEMRLRHIEMWPVRLYNIFPRFLIKGRILLKRVLNTKCVFGFPLKL